MGNENHNLHYEKFWAKQMDGDIFNYYIFLGFFVVGISYCCKGINFELILHLDTVRR